MNARLKPAPALSKRPRPYRKGGFYRVKVAVKHRGLDAVDRRTGAGRAIARDREWLVEHVGGEPSATQELTIEGVQIYGLLIGAGVAALQEHGPVDRRKLQFRRVALELAGLIEKRHRLLVDLGLERKAKPVPSLAAYLQAKAAEAPTPTEPAA